MGTIVAAGAASHAPTIAIARRDADPEAVARFDAGMARLADTVRAAEPDTLVLVTNEHFANFYLNNVPTVCVGTGSYHRGPSEAFLGEEKLVPGDRPTAKALVQSLVDQGAPVSFSEDLWFDHGTWVPLTYLNPDLRIPVVPLVMNNLIPPIPSPRAAYEFGRRLRAAIESLPADHRVALVGTGGLSHKVGTPDAGEVDPEWDRRFLDGVAKGEGERLSHLTHAELDSIGNGTHEVRNWLTVMGALAEGTTAEVTAYENIPSWVTGCGVAVFRL